MRRLPLTILLVTMAVVFGLYSFFTPYVIDDMMFTGEYLRCNGGDSTFSLSSLADYARQVRQVDNGRLSNILVPVVTLMTPHWLFAAITGAGFALMFYLMTRIARIPAERRAGIILVTWALSLILLPWRNYIIVCDYLLNYLYPTLFILAFVILMAEATDGRLSAGRFVAALVIAPIAAWFHEGFSFSICMGLAALAMVRRFRLSGQWWALAVVFGAVAVYVALAPGILNRANNEFNGMGVWEKAKFVLSILPAVGAALCVFAGCSFSARLRPVVRTLLGRPAFLILLVAMVSLSALLLILNSDSRSGWPCEIFALIILQSFVPFLHLRPSKVLNGALIALYCAMVLFFCHVIRWQYRFWVQHRQIEALMNESPTGTAYYDIIDPRSARVSTLFMATRNPWVLPYQFNVINNNNAAGEGRYFSVVPTVLRDYSEGAGRPVAGSANLIDYKGVLVGEDGHYVEQGNGYYSDDEVYDIVGADGTLYPGVHCMRVRFADSDGKYQMYVYLPSYIPVPVRRVESLTGSM